jgi:hypothetical protein
VNPYLTVENREPRRANRYYGRVDSVEAIDNQNSEKLIQLDGVDVISFDAELFHGVPFTDAMDRLSLCVLEFSTLNVSSQLRGQLQKLAQPGAWLLVQTAERRPTTVDVDYYPGLFADAVTQSSIITPVDEKLARTLSAAFSMDDLPDESEAGITSLLDPIGAVDFITVYDIGQGNLNALWTSHGGAGLYFDFGGGVTANKTTFPKAPGKLCWSRQPPVVLSHWDWDHWSSAGRFSQVLHSHWIVPRCDDLGAHHRALAWDLHRRGHLHIWPHGMTDYPGTYLKVEKCTGSGRNDSGLAMIVHGEETAGARREALLTGDAAYDCIPEVKNGKTRFGAVVASHHGAIVDSIAEIRPTAQGSLIYSVGNGNQFCHPRLRAELEYLLAGWAPQDTYSTSQRVRKRPNAIAIQLSRRPVETACADCTAKLVC